MKISFNYISTNRRALLCCLGGFLLCLGQSLDYSYPNLNTYITSYCRKIGFVAGRRKTNVDFFHFQTEPRSDLRRLHICDGGQEPDPGNLQSPRRICFPEAGREANHLSGLLHTNVTSDFTLQLPWLQS